MAVNSFGQSQLHLCLTYRVIESIPKKGYTIPLHKQTSITTKYIDLFAVDKVSHVLQVSMHLEN